MMEDTKEEPAPEIAERPMGEQPAAIPPGEVPAAVLDDIVGGVGEADKWGGGGSSGGGGSGGGYVTK